MPGWGNYKPRKKSQAELDLERRRELGMKFPSDTAELVAIAARARRNVKVLPYSPPDDIKAAGSATANHSSPLLSQWISVKEFDPSAKSLRITRSFKDEEKNVSWTNFKTDRDGRLYFSDQSSGEQSTIPTFRLVRPN